MKTVVVNLRLCPPAWRSDPRYVYCGRPGKGLLGSWGNPHPIGFCAICHARHDRETAIAAHRSDTLARWERDAAFRERLRRELRGKFLVCFCADPVRVVPCHCDIYAELAERIDP